MLIGQSNFKMPVIKSNTPSFGCLVRMTDKAKEQFADDYIENLRGFNPGLEDNANYGKDRIYHPVVDDFIDSTIEQLEFATSHIPGTIQFTESTDADKHPIISYIPQKEIGPMTFGQTEPAEVWRYMNSAGKELKPRLIVDQLLIKDNKIFLNEDKYLAKLEKIRRERDESTKTKGNIPFELQGNPAEVYEKGFYTGYEEGYDIGQTEGYVLGYQDAKKDGGGSTEEAYEDGVADGREEGYQEAKKEVGGDPYQDGIAEGYARGYEDALAEYGIDDFDDEDEPSGKKLATEYGFYDNSAGKSPARKIGKSEEQPVKITPNITPIVRALSYLEKDNSLVPEVPYHQYDKNWHQSEVPPKAKKRPFKDLYQMYLNTNNKINALI